MIITQRRKFLLYQIIQNITETIEVIKNEKIKFIIEFRKVKINEQIYLKLF